MKLTVRIVSLKNKHKFLHPAEALQYTEDSLEIPKKVARISEDKRKNDIFWHTGYMIEDDLQDGEEEEMETGRNDEMSVDEQHQDMLAPESQEINIEIPNSTDTDVRNPPNSDVRNPPNSQNSQSSQGVRSPSLGFFGRSLPDTQKFVQSNRRGNLKLPDPSQVFIPGKRKLRIYLPL